MYLNLTIYSKLLSQLVKGIPHMWISSVLKQACREVRLLLMKWGTGNCSENFFEKNTHHPALSFVNVKSRLCIHSTVWEGSEGGEQQVLAVHSPKEKHVTSGGGGCNEWDASFTCILFCDIACQQGEGQGRNWSQVSILLRGEGGEEAKQNVQMSVSLRKRSPCEVSFHFII